MLRKMAAFIFTFLFDTERGVEKHQTPESVDDEYRQLQELILNEDLPCSKEEASALAGIQLRIEESWPSKERITSSKGGTSQQQQHDNGGQDKLITITEDIKESVSVSESPLHGIQNGSGDLYQLQPHQELSTSKHRCMNNSVSPKITSKESLLRRCIIGTSYKSTNITSNTLTLQECLPSVYHNVKNIAKIVKEQKRKLFHTSVYESELHLKKLYILSCKRLPAYGCKTYQVKELVRSKTKKKTNRLLAIGPERIVLLDNKTRLLNKSQLTSDLQQWQTGGGRSHDRLILEFRGTKWSFVAPSQSTLKSIGFGLWEMMQQIDTKFIEENILQTTSIDSFSNGERQFSVDGKPRCGSLKYTAELEHLQKILHFPEEVALALTKTEYDLFYQVQPWQYIRHIIVDLSLHGSCYNEHRRHHPTTTQSLIQRFNEVSSWVTHIIISQPTHDDRKAVLSCILRTALTCWNIGNFNTSMEIVAGLKSEKLKPFWLSLSEKESLPVLEMLTNALLTSEPSKQYREAVDNALSIPRCRVIPFFGSFLRDLRAVFNGMPNLLVISEIDNIDFASDCNGEDQFSTKMGVGGIVNMEKLKQVQQILDDVRAFHYHKQKRDELLSASMNLDLDDLWSNCMSYKPVQTISSDHGVSFIPLSSTAIDINNLQCLHHGTTVIRWEEDTSRVSACHLRFDRSNAYLIWSKPTWSTTRGSEYHLSSSIEDPVIAGIGLDYTSSDMVCDSLEDGYLLLSSIKEVCLGYDSNVDVSLISRRFSLDDISKDKNCLVLFYGSNLSDNRRIEFVGPVEVILLWYEGLTQILTVYQKMKEFPDRRINWLKQRYMQLYYQDGVCEGPIPAEAIKVFGGRKWTLGGVGGSGSNLLSAEIGCHGFKRAASLGMSTNKFRKKKSSGNLNLVKDPSQRHSGDSPSMERPTSALIPRSSLIVTPQTVARVLSGVKYTCNSKQNSSKDRSFEQKSNLTPVVNTHCLSQNFRERYKYKRNGRVSDGPVFQQTVITHSSHIDFLEFTDLFKSFIVRCRKDLKDLFEQVANKNPSPNEKTQVEPSKSNYAAENTDSPVSLTRNTMCDLDRFSNRKRICDAIAAASIVTNSTGIDTSTNLSINVKTFQSFMSQYQNEKLSHEQILELIERHEPDEEMRKQGFLSFQGFARFLMDKHNFAFLSEETVHDESEMDHALSDYYIASSHNTYLTGHQLKGESSVELYSQVLLTGCRCVELDCWDGDDGMPVIYHGHTLTTKIPFKDVVEAINKSAFVTSPYPVILSIENHCSVQQQAKMAQIFLSVFGDKLLTRMISDLDFDDPQLPSPNHLKYKVLIKNKKLRTRVYAAMKNKSKSDMRANSIASNTSTCSLNDEEDDDYDDEDDDDDDDLSDDRETGIMNDSPSGLNLLGSQEDKQSSVDTGSLTKSASMGMRTESLSSQEESIKEKVNGNHRPKSQSDADWPEANYQAYKQRKSSAQIAKELSDLVVYCQAIKFRGLLHTTSPATTAKIKKMTKKASVMVSPVGLKPSTPPPPTETKTNLDYASSNNTISRRHMLSAPCYQVSSMNENTAKKLCRKQPQSLIAHTEVQLIRTYPAGIRIDSSNFNPIMFWAFGMQMVALNYQTEDTALHINTAMFEQNGNCGYVLKPRVMWDHTHMMYRRFNPWDKEFDGLHMINIEITVIAGQYVCQNNNAGSAMVEVEIIGIPADCCRQKTKLVQRNSLNPIWNDTFNFKVAFGDLAFIKFTITDVGTNHITAQRVMPLKSLRPGYRHVRLRNLQNQPLELSSLFIFSHSEEEGLDMTDKNDDGLEDNMVILDQINCNVTDDKLGGNESFSLSSVPLKRRMFFLVVHGVTQDEQSTILKITQESTTREVIKQSLAKAHKLENKCPDDYIMIEEVSKGWSKKDQDKVTSHRILDMDERPLEAQDQWKGEGKLILKKTGDDPSSRAWMTTIKSSTDKNRRKKMSDRPQMNDLENDWEDEEEMFLVCVYNVSPDQPYTILRAPVTSTAQDLIAQALVKAHRMTDPTQFVLVEQIDYGEFTDACAGPMKRRNTLRNERRLLGDDENVYQVQARWKGKGWFELRSKNEAPQEKKLLKNLRLSKLHQSFRSKSKSKMKNKEETPPVERQTSGSTEDIPKNNCVATAAAQVRNIHSEGEILSDDEIKDTKFSVQHLKRLSLRKFKVWR
ncbi:PLCE1 (predicted) [Pycnogonum litorale]